MWSSCFLLYFRFCFRSLYRSVHGGRRPIGDRDLERMGERPQRSDPVVVGKTTGGSASNEVLRIQMLDHVVTVTNSTLIAAGGRAIELLGANRTVSIFPSPVDVPTAFVDTAAASTLTCATLSTPAGAAASGCV